MQLHWWCWWADAVMANVNQHQHDQTCNCAQWLPNCKPLQHAAAACAVCNWYLALPMFIVGIDLFSILHLFRPAREIILIILIETGRNSKRGEASYGLHFYRLQLSAVRWGHGPRWTRSRSLLTQCSARLACYDMYPKCIHNHIVIHSLTLHCHCIDSDTTQISTIIISPHSTKK